MSSHALITADVVRATTGANAFGGADTTIDEALANLNEPQRVDPPMHAAFSTPAIHLMESPTCGCGGVEDNVTCNSELVAQMHTALVAPLNCISLVQTKADALKGMLVAESNTTSTCRPLGARVADSITGGIGAVFVGLVMMTVDVPFE
jgi:hypothetical protein